MGVYDTFNMVAPCWKCGQPLNDWQTKQLESMMWVYKKGDKIHGGMKEGTVSVYTYCVTPKQFILNVKTDEVDQPWVSNEAKVQYCSAWNNAVVYIKEGIVDSIEVMHQG